MFDENVNVADARVHPAAGRGPVRIVVSGVVGMTVHDRESGVGSWFPAASTARTENVCPVGASPEYDLGLVQAANAAPSSEHWNVAPGSSE